MAYTDRQVERGRKIVSTLDKAAWSLGDLALDVAPAVTNMNAAGGMDWATSPQRRELEQFADAIDLEYETLMQYRRVAAAYPPDVRRADVSWTVHRRFTSLENPVRVLRQRRTWTTTTARQYVDQVRGRTVAPPRPAPLPPDERVKVAKEALRDPQLARQVLDEPEVSRAASRAQRDLANDDYEARQHQTALDDPDQAAQDADLERRSRSIRLSNEFRDLIRHAKSDLISAIERWGEIGRPLDDEHRESVLGELQKVINAANAVAEAVNGGSNVDAGLVALLGRES